MKYIHNPVTNTLEEIDKIKVPEEKTDMVDHVDRMLHMYEGAPLSEKNKRIDKAKAKRTKDNIDPKRPVISDHDVVFATMNPQEALNFTQGDPEKIKFMRQVKTQNRKQQEYDKKKAERIVPSKVSLDSSLDRMIDEPVRPILTVRRDPDLDKGIVSILNLPKKF